MDARVEHTESGMAEAKEASAAAAAPGQEAVVEAGAAPGQDVTGISAAGIRSFFELPVQNIHAYSPLTLAYIGDSIYDLVIRTMHVEEGNKSVNRLHYQTSRLVRAHAQSAMMEYLMPELTDAETAVYKRGRNAKSYTMAKNATVADYRRATGFEALMGWLYLTDQTERMLALIDTGLAGYRKEMKEAQDAKARK